MCIIIPFKAVRPPKEFVQDVASYPYDIIDTEEARTITENNPRSFLHVVKSEIDLPPHVDIHDERVYSKAKENFNNFLHDGTLFQEQKPSFYVYRQQMGEHRQYGIVGCVSVDEYESGRIKKHELTRPDKEADRTKHIAALNAQTGPVFLAYRRRQLLDQIVQEIADGVPEYDFTADDGISHTAWIMSDENTIEIIQKEFLAIDALYIADGHHRAASAAAVARMRRADNPGYSGHEEFNFMMAVIFPGYQLKVLAYNRVVKDLNDLSATEFMDKVEEKFIVTENFIKKVPEQLHEFGMYIKGSWYRLRAKEDTYIDRDVIGTLDVSLIQDHLLGPILGIGDVRTDERIMFVGGIRGVEELEQLVDSGECAVAFSLYPTTIHQLADVADTDKLMPPKSSWFEPKLRSGMFVHLID